MANDPHSSFGLYDSRFFRDLTEGSASSASVIAPLAAEWLKPRSVLDVGCGEGAWLEAFRCCGVRDVFGVDGCYVDRAKLLIEETDFREVDLAQPLMLHRHFDLVLCLEVAEHIPQSGAEILVESLVRHGAVILFSASIPFQDGTGHVNEQWPHYWIAKFAQRGYHAVDCLRPVVWNDKRVRWWFAQNAMFFVEARALAMYKVFERCLAENRSEPLPLVHPNLLFHKQSMLNSPRWLVKQLARALRSRIFSNW